MNRITAAPRRPAASTASAAPRQVLLSVWCPRVGEFTARVVLEDGSVLHFDSPFELVRYLATPPVPPMAPAETSGLR